MADSKTGFLRAKWRSVWQRQRAVIIAAAAVTAVSVLVVGPWNAKPRLEWWQWLDAVLGVATFAVALLVWWGECTENWERSLPKRLRLVFIYEGQPAFICENASLTSEGDLRALSQQIGKQMNDNCELKLRPFSEPLPPRITDTASGPVRHYELRTTLSEMPKVLLNRPGEYKLWRIDHGLEQESFQPVQCGQDSVTEVNERFRNER